MCMTASKEKLGVTTVSSSNLFKPMFAPRPPFNPPPPYAIPPFLCLLNLRLLLAAFHAIKWHTLVCLGLSDREA